MAKTLKVTFSTAEGKNFSVSMAYADPALLGEGGAAKVQTAMEAAIAQQPFNVTLASIAGAELIDRQVTTLI